MIMIFGWRRRALASDLQRHVGCWLCMTLARTKPEAQLREGGLVFLCENKSLKKYWASQEKKNREWEREIWMSFLNKAFPLIEKQNTEARATRNCTPPPTHTHKHAHTQTRVNHQLPSPNSSQYSITEGKPAETGPFSLVTCKDDREVHLLGELIPLGSLQWGFIHSLSRSLSHSFIHLIRNSAVCTQWRTLLFLFPSSPISEFPIRARL